MRKLLVAMITILMIQSAYAIVECEKKGRYWRPKNEKAIKIADSLRVKTCTGERFLAVVKGLGETSNVKVKPKKLSVDELIKKMKGVK